jgi:hypothetical protein
MDKLLVQVPAKLHRRFREIVGITDPLCEAYLHAEFRDICREMAVAFFQNGSAVSRGKVASWAADERSEPRRGPQALDPPLL